MTPGILNIEIYKGSLFQKNIDWKDSNGVLVPITDFVWKMQIRETFDDPTVIYELNENNGGIVPTDPGELVLFIPASVTQNFTFWTAVYDLEFEPPTGPQFRDKLLRGKATLKKEATL